jgi:DNA polymerase III subunit gamma/tau
MKYLVLARRYRPQKFSDVIGQEAIITTLKNALSFDRVAHAYLFCGSRGVGKTTVARLFAKALNCQAPEAGNEPCNRCPSCLEILSGQSLDVIEIDGASNRGIDDIRQLNETIGYAPSHGKFKIYIIDEVHMLTKEAFNALLKTLEEPPERAKFFFATTEPHKVLTTIISRCQRFDMQRLTEAQIVQKLISIAADLKRDVSPEAMHLIASFAEGSLRDAESLFDQTLCFTDGSVQAEQVRNVLGLVPDELFFELDNAFNEGRVSFAFDLVERLFQMGKDLSHFLEQLTGHYRRLALAKTMGTSSLGLPEPLFSRTDRAIRLYTQAQLFYILETLLNAFPSLQKSPMQRASLESIFLHVLRSKNRIPMEVLIRRLNELEQKLSETEPSPLSPEMISTPQPQAEKNIAVERIACRNPTPEGVGLGKLYDNAVSDDSCTASLGGGRNSSLEGGVLQAGQFIAPPEPEASFSPPALAEKTKEPSTNENRLDKPIPLNSFKSHAETTPAACATVFEKQENRQTPPSATEPVLPKAPANQNSSSPAEPSIKPVAFNPFKSHGDAAPTACATVFEKQENKQTPPSAIEPVLPKAPSKVESKSNPGRYETLLRFAAVELEGTIKN